VPLELAPLLSSASKPLQSQRGPRGSSLSRRSGLKTGDSGRTWWISVFMGVALVGGGPLAVMGGLTVGLKGIGSFTLLNSQGR